MSYSTNVLVATQTSIKTIAFRNPGFFMQILSYNFFPSNLNILIHDISTCPWWNSPLFHSLQPRWCDSIEFHQWRYPRSLLIKKVPHVSLTLKRPANHRNQVNQLKQRKLKWALIKHPKMASYHGEYCLKKRIYCVLSLKLSWRTTRFWTLHSFSALDIECLLILMIMLKKCELLVLCESKTRVLLS